MLSHSSLVESIVNIQSTQQQNKYFCNMRFFKMSWLLAFCGTVLVFNFNTVEAVFFGDPASSGEFPYVVAISVENKENKSANALCTGSIISDQWILTAAHCFSSNGSQHSYGGNITTGIYQLPWWFKSELTPVPVAIEKVILRDFYNRLRNTPMVDIALVKVARKFEWSDKVQPIAVARSDIIPPGSAVQGEVAGWASNNQSELVHRLQKANMTVFGYDMCSKVTVVTWLKREKHDLFEKGVNECGRGHSASTCFGDSGTAIVVDGVQIGVVSHLLGNVAVCSEPYDMGYVPIYKYFSWIQHHCGQCLPETVNRVPKPLVLSPDLSRWKSPSYRVSVYDARGKVVCTGTLIGDRWVLTTASCVRGDKVAFIGPWGADTGFVKVNRTVVPNDFHPSRALHDVALLELGSQGGWVERVPKVRLDPGFLSPRSIATHIGIQRFNEYGFEYPGISETLVHVTRDEDCRKYYPGGDDFDPKSMFCGIEAIEPVPKGYYKITEGVSVIRSGAIVGLKLKVYEGMSFHNPLRFTRITRRYVEWIDGHCDCLEYLRPQPKSFWNWNETSELLLSILGILNLYYERKDICETLRGWMKYLMTIVKRGCVFVSFGCMEVFRKCLGRVGRIFT